MLITRNVVILLVQEHLGDDFAATHWRFFQSNISSFPSMIFTLMAALHLFQRHNSIMRWKKATRILSPSSNVYSLYIWAFDHILFAWHQVWAGRIGEASPILIPICQKVGEAIPIGIPICQYIMIFPNLFGQKNWGKSGYILILPDFGLKSQGESRYIPIYPD